MNTDSPSAATPKHRLRRADFKTGLLLAAVASYMLYTAFGYPLQESYGGVENSWYVSPALLPILVASLLLFFAVLLTLNALRYAIVNNLLGEFGDWRQFLPGKKTAKTFLVLLYIGGYTYVLIERIDFVIATSLFLLGFIGAFYVSRDEKIVSNAILYLIFCVLCWILVAIWPGLQTAPYFIADGCSLVAFASLYWLMRNQVQNDAAYRSRLLVALLTSIATALVIAVSFRFGLLVPLPQEGIVLEMMHLIRGILR